MVFDRSGTFSFALNTSDIKRYVNETSDEHIIINPLKKSVFSAPNEEWAISKISQYFGKIFGENSPIIDSSKYLFDIYSTILNKYDLENKNVLDFGCGNSTYKSMFKNSEYVGYDLESNNKNDDFIKGDFYDFVLANFVLEHVANPFLTIDLISGSLKRSGKIIISIPILTFRQYLLYVFGIKKLRLPIFHFRAFSITNFKGCISIFKLIKSLEWNNIAVTEIFSLTNGHKNIKTKIKKPFSFFGNQMIIVGEKN
ncbi:class I SAM-dependent methyltransferase [Saccharicrinis sp. FJH2]|uniref:class I SAM-dependent methyltransferase n=1 Tax=Saccharicrinis sp. FJH65 TaxID=3344659 RepID=UPI0035F424F5